ncbi:MAG TPA: M20/M25/M40 family metallo-hydrolase [Desulfurivibrio alkaliphilus]|uniref:M20/M25/M40 family metallo-hydrolase n=1 Tax=Desulfurivibrio alkaliphilus TaxID=427923 RepID=A0A7C2XG79_9BACT|nr:M20/M25/M40 family metallo-hydrolase [Desulfurivibrio alkaliphilus]
MNSFPPPDQKLTKWMVEIRRHLRRHPELSGEEHQTCRYIMNKLQELGIASRRVHHTGVLATIGNPAATDGIVALRADLDTLPIGEETGLAFASRVPGVMHACGHDGHVAMLLGAAALAHGALVDLTKREGPMARPTAPASISTRRCCPSEPRFWPKPLSPPQRSCKNNDR